MCRKILPSNQRTLCVQTLFLNTPIFNNSVVTKLSICCLSFVWQYITTCYPAWIIPRPERKSKRTSKNNKSPTEKRIFFRLTFLLLDFFHFTFFLLVFFFRRSIIQSTISNVLSSPGQTILTTWPYFDTHPQCVAMSFAYERLLTSVTFVLWPSAAALCVSNSTSFAYCLKIG